MGSEGFICPQCGEKIETESIEVKRDRRAPSKPVFVVEDSMISFPIVSQPCPRCESTKAYRVIMTSQGEHAGIKQDRTVERYTCVECGHTWLRT
jgi:DNA-directed RNA polymerase subunit M/transcription elongation factor TFIIS